MPRPELRIVAGRPVREYEYAEAQRPIEVARRDGITFSQIALTVAAGFAALAMLWLIAVCAFSLAVAS